MNFKLFRGIFHPPYVRIREDVEISAKRPQKNLEEAAHISFPLKIAKTDACKNPILWYKKK